MESTVERTAREHVEAFFRGGKHTDLLRIACGPDRAAFDGLADKYVCKHLSHLRGEAWHLAYEGIIAELRRRAGRD